MTFSRKRIGMVSYNDTECTGKSSFHFCDAGSDLWQAKEKKKKNY